jgi:hypothetical protein
MPSASRSGSLTSTILPCTHSARVGLQQLRRHCRSGGCATFAVVFDAAATNSRTAFNGMRCLGFKCIVSTVGLAPFIVTGHLEERLISLNKGGPSSAAHAGRSPRLSPDVLKHKTKPT